MNLNLLLISVILISSLPFTVAEGDEDNSEIQQASVGSIAPDFTLVDTENNTFNLSDYRGELVVIEMMATWCGLCKNMADGALMAINNDINDGDLVDVRIISIGVDRDENNTDLKNLSTERGYHWQHAIDTNFLSLRDKTANKELASRRDVSLDKGYITFFIHGLP